LAALVRAATERRLLVWSAHPEEQRALDGTVLAGSLPTDDGDRPTVGVFLNDGTGAKLSYYLEGSVHVGAGSCRADGRRELRVRVTLRSTAPKSGLSTSVLGNGRLVPRYVVRTNVFVFSPAAGAVVDARRDGRGVPLGVGVERGRAVGVLTVDLRPGRTGTVEFTLLTGIPGAGVTGAFLPVVWTTPGVKPWSNTTETTTFCRPKG
jgi:hypothetical protein